MPARPRSGALSRLRGPDPSYRTLLRLALTQNFVRALPKFRFIISSVSAQISLNSHKNLLADATIKFRMHAHHMCTCYTHTRAIRIHTAAHTWPHSPYAECGARTARGGPRGGIGAGSIQASLSEQGRHDRGRRLRQEGRAGRAGQGLALTSIPLVMKEGLCHQGTRCLWRDEGTITAPSSLPLAITGRHLRLGDGSAGTRSRRASSGSAGVAALAHSFSPEVDGAREKCTCFSCLCIFGGNLGPYVPL